MSEIEEATEDVQHTEQNNTIQSEVIDVEHIEEKKETSIELEFGGNSSILDDFEPVDAPKIEKEDAGEEDENEATTVEELKAQVISEEVDQQFDLEDIELISEMMVEGLAWGLSWTLAFVAMDKDDSKYCPTDQRNKKLSKILTKGLVRMNLKFNFMAAFVFMILITYGTLTASAIKNRKEVKKKIKEDEENKPVEIERKQINRSKKPVVIETVPFEEKKEVVKKDSENPNIKTAVNEVMEIEKKNRPRRRK